MKVYIIGSLRNPQVPIVAEKFRNAGFDVFDDWYAAGPEADDAWRAYEKDKGSTYREALQGHAARHVFEFDKHHLDTADAAVLVGPAGKSGHLELGYVLGQGKPGIILLDQATIDSRWDVMYQFANLVTTDAEEGIQFLLAREPALPGLVAPFGGMQYSGARTGRMQSDSRPVITKFPPLHMGNGDELRIGVTVPTIGWHSQVAADLARGEAFGDERYAVHNTGRAP